MNYPLLALCEPAPPGFELRRELSRRDLRRTAFALFASSVEAAEAAITKVAPGVTGIVVTDSEVFVCAELRPGLQHFGVPPALRTFLPELLLPHLRALEAHVRLADLNRAQLLELTRARDDRSRLVREYGDLRASLLEEIRERRAAERALQIAHDELEVRVEQRTEQLGRVNEALCAEIAERRRVDRALTEERQRLNMLMESVPDSIYFKDRENRFLQINRALARRFELDAPADAVGRTEFEFLSPEQARAAYEDELQVMHTELPVIGKIESEVLPDGRTHWASTTRMPLRDSEGAVVGTFGISRDITSLKRAEEELRETNAKLREVLEDLTRSHEELKGAQLQLIQAEKMQSVGRLAAGIAHEVKNPLAIMEMGLECLSRNGHVPDEQFHEVTAEMRDAVKRATSVIGGLLDFSSSNQLDIRASDLNAVVESALRLMKHELINGKITAVRRLDRTLPPCRLDANKIEQVFINIFTNACHAMPAGGHLSICSYARTVTEDETKGGPGDRSGARFWKNQRVAIVEVRDSGPGIAADDLPKIFDPFYTTKPTGKGTGLGLTVVRKIVDLHGGRIEIGNDPEGGVLVTVIFKID
ncbi:MAG: ATP-binding protein [Chthoniobacteraceae bacterium]